MNAIEKILVDQIKEETGVSLKNFNVSGKSVSIIGYSEDDVKKVAEHIQSDGTVSLYHDAVFEDDGEFQYLALVKKND